MSADDLSAKIKELSDTVEKEKSPQYVIGGVRFTYSPDRENNKERLSRYKQYYTDKTEGAYGEKYKGYSSADIEKVIASASRRGTMGESELNWLKRNRYRDWSKEDLEFAVKCFIEARRQIEEEDKTN